MEARRTDRTAHTEPSVRRRGTQTRIHRRKQPGPVQGDGAGGRGRSPEELGLADHSTVGDLALAVEELRRDIHRMETHIGLISHGLALRRAVEDTSPGSVPAVAAKPKAAPDLPHWIDARDVQTKIGLTPAQLKKFSGLGYVRTAKLGESRQAACIYNTVDVLDALDRIAAGYEPRRKRKTP